MMDMCSACIKQIYSVLLQLAYLLRTVKCNQMDNMNGELQINFSLLKVQRILTSWQTIYRKKKCLIGKEFFFPHSELSYLKKI